MKRPHDTLLKTACAVEAAGGAPMQVPEGERAAEARRIYCRYYDTCLNYAEARSWTSFSCAACSVTEEIPDEMKRAAAAGIQRAFGSAHTLRLPRVAS